MFNGSRGTVRITRDRCADTNDLELLSKLDGFRSGLDEGNGDLPAGFIDKLKEPVHDKLRGTKRTPFSKVDPMTLLSLKISFGPPFLISEKRQAIEHRVYVSMSMDTTWFLICLVRDHVATVVCDLKTALANLKFIDGLVTSNIFEAKRDNVRAAIAAASYSQLHYSTIRGVVTSQEQWVFVAYERCMDGTGPVQSSPEYSLGTNLEGLALALNLLQDLINNTTSSGHAFFSLS
ncbi:hypothetical protein L210DRAFT_966258 [Boletus edulis BED1]|uniref:Uncharacterized protein n=1 Tax=Boletus edulis BED1 TaxID=1328754 RepID=A0AAD4BG86_BOLED|nr:hypothetical protein L210DRAFT_966258 [Boletus edulis BED1]